MGRRLVNWDFGRLFILTATRQSQQSVIVSIKGIPTMRTKSSLLKQYLICCSRAVTVIANPVEWFCLSSCYEAP